MSTFIVKLALIKDGFFVEETVKAYKFNIDDETVNFYDRQFDGKIIKIYSLRHIISVELKQ